MEPRQATTEGLTIYRDEMRDYINRTIQANHDAKEGWLRAWAAGLPDNHRLRRERIKKGLDRGEIPTTLFDVGDFQHLIAANPDWFDESLRPGRHHYVLLSEIAQMRNQIAHLHEAVARADAEEILSRCVQVLGLAGKERAAGVIRDLIRQMGPSLERSDLKGLAIYRDEMRDYINRTIQVNHPAKEGWLRAWAAGLPDNQRVRRERIEKALDRGRIPTTLFDVGDFQHLIAAYPDWFDESLRPGQHHFQRLSQIAVVRNQIAHDRGTIYREDAEEVLSWCIEVLNLAGKERAASAIRDLIRQMGPSLERSDLTGTTEAG